MNLAPDSAIDKVQSGAKRSSWKKVHFRDLGLKVCEDNPGASVEELAQLFLDEINRFPEYLDSIAVYVMANVRASLTAGKSRMPPARPEENQTVIENLAKRVAARALLDFELPSGILLRHARGSDCTKAGGWLTAVGEKVGPKGIVGKKMTERDLRQLFKTKTLRKRHQRNPSRLDKPRG